MADNLEKQGGVYHVRMAIPKDVQSAFGNRRILSKSLGTSNRIEALTLRLPYLAKWKAEIKAHRAARQLPEDWQDTFASQVALIDRIKQHNKAKAIGVPAPSLPFAPPPTISEMITRFLSVNGIPEVPRAERDRVASALHLEETMSAALSKALEAVWQNKFAFQPNQSSELSTIIEDPSSYKPKSPITPARLDTFKAFCAKQGLTAKSVDIQLSKLEALSTFLTAEGNPLDFDTVTAWLDSLPFAPKTLRQYIWAGNQFWRWATKYDPRWREDFKGKPNPFEGHIVRQPRAKEAADTRRKAFSVNQLAGLHAAAQEKQLSSLADLILLGSYTGARIEELCQLRVEDVVTVEGISALSITDSKTEAGIRTVPIHPTLTPLVERLKDQSEDGYLCSGLLIPDTDLGENPRRERGV